MPKTDTTPAAALPVAGITTEAVLRELVAKRAELPAGTVDATLDALVARFDRKAERRAAKAGA